MFSSGQSELDDDEIWDLYDAIDIDHDNNLSAEEITNFLFQKGMNTAYVTRVFETLNDIDDGDHRITHEEFTEFMHFIEKRQTSCSVLFHDWEYITIVM